MGLGFGTLSAAQKASAPAAIKKAPPSAKASAGETSQTTGSTTRAKVQSGHPVHNIEPIQIVRNEFIMLRRLPHNEKALLKLFGERPKREERHIQNHHDQSMDTVVKLTFTNADMDLHVIKNRPGYVNFLGMTLSEHKKRLQSVLPLQVDNTREELEKTFEVDTEGQEHFEMCELQEITEGGPIFSSSCVVFSFQEDKVSKIDWVLPLD